MVALIVCPVRRDLKFIRTQQDRHSSVPLSELNSPVKPLLDLLGERVCCQIPVGRLRAQKKIPDGSADHI